MTDPKTNKLKEIWLMVWGFITRPFATCNGYDCCPFIGEVFQEGFEETTLVVVSEDGDQERLYVYYCPTCGRRMKDDKTK